MLDEVDESTADRPRNAGPAATSGSGPANAGLH